MYHACLVGIIYDTKVFFLQKYDIYQFQEDITRANTVIFIRIDEVIDVRRFIDINICLMIVLFQDSQADGCKERLDEAMGGSVRLQGRFLTVSLHFKCLEHVFLAVISVRCR